MKRVWALFALLFLLAGLVPAALAQGPVEPTQVPEVSMGTFEQAGVEDVGSSTLAGITPAQLPVGTPFNLCFTVFVQSPDAEYMDHFDVDLPDNWTVNSVAPDSVPPANGCGGALPPVVGVGAGNVVYWQSTGYPPQTGCGAWNGGAAGTNFDFCANITVPDNSGAPWMFPWNYVGDGWGSPPHQASGNFGPVEPQPPLMIEPPFQFHEGCACEVQDHSVRALNNDAVDVTLLITYTLEGPGTGGGPPTVGPIPPGGGVNIPLNLRLSACALPSQTITMTIQFLAQPTGVTATAVLVKHNLGQGYWEWFPENQVLGALPDDWWAMGDGIENYGDPSMYWWMTGGVYNGGITSGSWYWDWSVMAWVNGGAMPNAVYRTEGDVQNNDMYNVGGSTSGFTPQNYNTQHQDGGPWVARAPAPSVSMDNVIEVWPAMFGGNDHSYLVGGYGLAPAGAYEYDPVADAWTVRAANPFTPIDYPVDGCFGYADEARTDPVIIQFPDTTSPQTNLLVYHIAGDTWEEWAVPAGFPAGIWALDVAMDYERNLCYITGGASAPGPGNLTSFYIYDPVSNTAHRGPDFTTPRDFHASWYFDGLLCIAGGADPSGAGLLSTQCAIWVQCPPCDPILGTEKMAPPVARHGEVISYAIVMTASGEVGMLAADPLPPGVEFAGNLTWSDGYAWYEPVDNAVYWRPGPPPTPPGLAAMPAPNLVTPAPDLEGSGPVRFSDLAGGPLPTVPAPDNEPAAPDKVTLLSLTYYGDRGAFDADHPGLPIEGFDNTLVPPGNITACDGPFDSSTNNACFSPGAILDGIRMDNVDPTLQMVVIGAGALGNPTPFVGPNTFVDHHDMTFFGADVYAVGFDLWSPLVATVFDVYIYGPGDVLLGQTSVAAGPTVVFWGVYSDNEPITRIRTESADGELFDNVAFGGAPPMITITFDVTVTGICGDFILNEGALTCGMYGSVFAAGTDVVGEPDISVDPMALSTELCPDETDQQFLHICNNGDCPLWWQILEMSPTMKLAGMPIVPAGSPTVGPIPDAPLTTFAVGKGPAAPAAPTNPEAVLWDQPLSITNTGTYANQDFEPAYDAYDNFIADDFSNGDWWGISTIYVDGNTWNAGCDLTCADALHWMIYADAGGMPAGDPWGGGNPPVWHMALPPNDPHVVLTAGTGGFLTNVTLNMDVPFYAPPGNWWLVFFPSMSFDGCACQSGRQVSDTTNGYPAMVINPGGGFFGGQATMWTSVQSTLTWGLIQQDFAFRLEGMAFPAADIPWVGEDPVSGTVWMGECATVTVDFDAAGMMPGDYFADLLLLNSDPDTPSITIPLSMTVYPPALASFDYDPDTGYVPLTVYFTDTSMYAMNPMWEFGDGGTSTETNPMHTYTTPGVYDVLLTVESMYGCGGVLTATGVVTVMCDPVQIITVTTDISQCVVTFGAELTGTAPFDYLWDFGAFGTSTETNPVVDFDATGTYSVTLEVWNCTDGYDTITFTVDVECVRLYYIYLPLVFKNYTAP